MLTRKKFLSLLDALVPELTDENEELLTSIKTDFDERDGYLRTAGTVIDDEDVDEFDYVVNEPETVTVDNSEELEKLKADIETLTSEYDALKTKYRDRFFYGSPEEKEEIEDEHEEVEEKTIEELLKED